MWSGCGGGLGSDRRFSLAIIRKGNVRAKVWESLFYKSIYRLDPDLSNPRVGGSNPPGGA